MYGWDWMDGSSSGDKKCSEYFVVVKIRFFLLVGFNEIMILVERGIGLLLKLTAGRFMNRWVLDLREKTNRMEYHPQYGTTQERKRVGWNIIQKYGTTDPGYRVYNLNYLSS